MAINFNAQFIVNEKTATRVLRLTDTSTGFTLAKGNFSVTFPDGSQVIHTDFISPDISAPGGSTDISLITDIDNTVLTGTYVIDFVAINAALTEFTKEETFDFNWEKPTKSINNESDVVLPDIKFVDSTPYESSGNFTGVLTRNFFTTTPSTSEVGVITKTSVGDILMPSHSSKYYEGIYLVKSDISVLYTHSSKSWLTVSYVDLLQETYDIREAPTQDELVGLMNTYKDQIEEYKSTNPSQYELLNEEYDLVIALYSHIIARFETNTLDGCKPILDQLLGLLPPQNPYTYKATQMLPFTINFTTSLTGTGTIGSIPKFTGAVSLGDSIIKEDTGKIGIGKTPTTTLDVNGAIQGTSIVKAGGTSSQFLKADGSIDASAYLTGITSGQVTTALGYTPYNATNPNAYIALTALSAGTGISYSNTTGVIASTITQYTDALARVAISLTTIGTSGAATYDSVTGILNIPSYIGGVTSFNTRTGAITLTSLDVTTALTFTPYNATNPSAFIALTALSAGTGISYNNTTGVIASTITQYTDALARASVSLTTTGTSGAATYDNTTGVFNIPQYQSVLTNPITGSGTLNYVSKFTSASSIGDSNIQDSGTLITLGSNTTISSGALGIGTTSLTAYNLRISKDITGASTAYGVYTDSEIQSDVSNAYVFISLPTLEAASFSLTNLYHYRAGLGGLGAGSSVETQVGFHVLSQINGSATNNYGFSGNLTKETGAYNLYMGGTADNYIAGSLGIGNTSLTGYNLRVSKNITGATSSFGIIQDGTIQSDVTAATSFRSTGNTQATSFTLSSLFHFRAAQSTLGAGSSITTQTGYYVDSTLTGATTNYGFRGQIPAQANAWNLFMDGTANNYLAGSLGIGTASLTGYSLRVSKNITGATTAYGVMSDGVIQSDVTTAGYYNRTIASTVASSFTLGTLVHYLSSQGTFGAGSNVTTQTGFSAASSLIGATTNYGFRGTIPSSGTANWNLYMDGTAPNYIAGSLGIGTTSALNSYNVRIVKNITGNAVSYGLMNQGEIQSDVTNTAHMFTSAPSTQAASFTLSNLYHYRAIQLTFGAGSTVTNQYGFFVQNTLIGATNDFGFYGDIPSGTNRWNLYMNGTANNYLAGNLLIGSTTDAGFKLDVNGTARVQGVLTTTADAVVNGVNIGRGGGNSSTSTVLGNSALSANTDGIDNTAIGSLSLTNITSGNNNISFGRNAGRFIADSTTFNTISNNSVFLGWRTKPLADNQTNQIVIGYDSTGLGSNTTVIGNASATHGRWYGNLLLGTNTNVASSILTMDSTTKGFLPPRMTLAQRTAIASPATGLIVYQTDGVEGLWLRVSTGWVELTVV